MKLLISILSSCFLVFAIVATAILIEATRGLVLLFIVAIAILAFILNKIITFKGEK